MARFNSKREQWGSSSSNRNTMLVDNVIYSGNLSSPSNIPHHSNETSQTTESYNVVPNPITEHDRNLYLDDSHQTRCQEDFSTDQDRVDTPASRFTVASLPISHSSKMNNNLSYTEHSKVKTDSPKEKKLSLKDSFSKSSHSSKAVKNFNDNLCNEYKQKTNSNINKQNISIPNKLPTSNLSCSDKDSSSKCQRRSSTSSSSLSSRNISSNSSSPIRPSSLHIPQSTPNKSQQKSNLHSLSQSSELPHHHSRSRKKSGTNKECSSTRRSLVGPHPTLHIPHHQLPTRSKSANPSTRFCNSSRNRKKSAIEALSVSPCSNSTRLLPESSNNRHTVSSNTICSGSGYESSDSNISMGRKAVDKEINVSAYQHEPSQNHVSTSSITLSNPQENLPDSRLQSYNHLQSSSSNYPHDTAIGAQSTTESSRLHGLSKSVSAHSHSDLRISGSSSSIPDTLQLGSWGNIDPQCLTRVSPATPPRAPTPPRSSASPHPHRRSVSPNFHRRSISPHLQPQPVSPHLPNSRRSMSPPPLPQNNLGQPPSPNLRQRLNPRPRSARTPSPRPPLPPSSAPVEQSPPIHRAPASPHAHLNKMRAR